MDELEGLLKELTRLDRLIQPTAKQPVDVNNPNWMELLRSAPKPLDQLNIRSQAEQLVARLLDAYEAGANSDRVRIRKSRYDAEAFGWAAGVADPLNGTEAFRRHLLWLSAMNGGRDWRDTSVELENLGDQALEAGIDLVPVLDEVAALSSTEPMHGHCSMRELLLDRKGRQVEGSS